MQFSPMQSASHRPKTGLLIPIARKTPSRVHTSERHDPFLTPARSRIIHKALSTSPYNSKLKEYKSAADAPYLQHSPNDLTYSWSSKPTENKFRIIRPCIIIKPDLERDLHLFGLCDGECKETASLVSTLFTDLIGQQTKIASTPKHSLKIAYRKTVAEVSSKTPHDFTALLICKGYLSCFSVGNNTVLIGRRSNKGWRPSKSIRRNSFQCKLESSEKIVIIGNSVLFAGLSPEAMVSIAGTYWDMKNPNIASWEIVDQVKSIESPMCLVLYIGN